MKSFVEGGKFTSSLKRPSKHKKNYNNVDSSIYSYNYVDPTTKERTLEEKRESVRKYLQSRQYWTTDEINRILGNSNE